MSSSASPSSGATGYSSSYGSGSYGSSSYGTGSQTSSASTSTSREAGVESAMEEGFAGSPSNVSSASGISVSQAMAEQLSQTEQTASREGNRMMNRGVRPIHQALSGTAQRLAQASERMDRMAQNLRDKEDSDWSANIRHMVRENPISSLALGVVAGWFLGRMWRT